MRPLEAVALEGVVRQFAPGQGVCGVTLGVSAGTCLAVLGRNGSGKSTLTRLLLGIERADAGQVRVLGGPPPWGNPRSLRRLGVALDHAPHWDGLSGWCNGQFFLRAQGGGRGRGAEERLSWWFEQAGLAAQAHQPVRTYSLGMRRKLALVQALVHDPELLVLDEPTAGVDAHFEAVLAEAIRRRGSRGRSTWVAGNDPEWIGTLDGQVALLDAGRVVAGGTVAELVAESCPWRKVSIRLARPLSAGLEVPPGVRVLDGEGTCLEALLGEAPALLADLLASLAKRGGEVVSLEVRGASLREVLLLHTGDRP